VDTKQGKNGYAFVHWDVAIALVKIYCTEHLQDTQKWIPKTSLPVPPRVVSPPSTPPSQNTTTLPPPQTTTHIPIPKRPIDVEIPDEVSKRQKFEGLETIINLTTSNILKSITPKLDKIDKIEPLYQQISGLQKQIKQMETELKNNSTQIRQLRESLGKTEPVIIEEPEGVANFRRFLKSVHFKIQPNLYMPFDETFIGLFNIFLASQNIKPTELTPDIYDIPFKELELSLTPTEEKTYPRNSTTIKKAIFISGIDMNWNCTQEDNVKENGF
jgi:regulator of replication initiation timing